MSLFCCDPLSYVNWLIFSLFCRFAHLAKIAGELKAQHKVERTADNRLVIHGEVDDFEKFGLLEPRPDNDPPPRGGEPPIQRWNLYSARAPVTERAHRFPSSTLCPTFFLTMIQCYSRFSRDIDLASTTVCFPGGPEPEALQVTLHLIGVGWLEGQDRMLFLHTCQSGLLGSFQLFPQ